MKRNPQLVLRGAMEKDWTRIAEEKVLEGKEQNLPTKKKSSSSGKQREREMKEIREKFQIKKRRGKEKRDKIGARV